MKTSQPCFLAAFLCFATLSRAEVKITPDRLDNEHASPGFKFPHVPAPLRGDAAAKATFTLLDGQRDGNGGDLDKLHDGRVPTGSDEPGANFFFRGPDGGRLLVDLGSVIEIRQINTYSWHTDSRGPQVYRLYASDGKAADFKAQPKRPDDPAKAGWKLLASVDTRPKDGPLGGQYGVSIADSAGGLGSARYLLFDIFRTEDTDSFGQTFYSEIDVVDRNAAPEVAEPQLTEAVEIDGGAYRFTVDTTEAPDLTEWSHRELIPAMQKWYPLIVKMLPSDGYTAPKTFSILFLNSYKGVAATGGNRIECNPSWYRTQLKGEAIGSLVHELVHVVQQYGHARRPNATRAPGWLVEGIPDYIRWFLYEPQSHGAEISPKRAATARYDASYRTSANFLNWVIGKYDKDLIKDLNAALREGRYDPELWKTRTKHTVEELADEWKKSLEGATAP
ncbi:MAG: hypothetical protein QOE70_3578 [Chthoniobacter sp.]|jgi:hypothetical protein|nr:hypothetical protein [Chthoniobacter sp.]